MVRLKHAVSGVVVQVTEEKAARLGSEWEVVPAPKPARKPKSGVKQD